MQVVLEEIIFNHDTDSATCDAFNIRRNETQAVTTPEWRRGISVNPEDSPAAYARNAVHGQTLTVKAKFSCDSPGQKVWIRALDGRLDPVDRGQGIRFVADVLRPIGRQLSQSNVLGEARATEVEFVETEVDDLTFELENVRIEQAGIGIDDIVWHWQFSEDGWNWTDITTTTHRIYIVLALPGSPWEPNSDNSNTQLPWTAVLDYACHWAAGAMDLKSAAFQITKSINLLGPAFVEYDIQNGGSPFYTPNDPLRLDCQRFLDLLKTRNPIYRLVNCDDCAAIVCAFANVLGCSLPESTIVSPHKSEFSLRRHQKIGQDWETFDQFNFHAIAWAGADEDLVSDACLKLDANISGVGAPIPTIASNMAFAGDGGYRHRLVRQGEQCELLAKFYRRIGLSFPPIISPPGPDIMEAKQRAQLLLDAFAHFAIDGWSRVELRFVPEDTLEAFWKMDAAPERSTLLLTIQAAATDKEVDNKLKRQLRRFELPVVRPKENAGFGDEVFANESGFVILFSQSQFFCLLRNVGIEFVSMWEVARIIDDFLQQLSNH
jgi:hypothetical protein